MTDKTTDEATSHLTNPARDAGQVIGYSHSTRLPKDRNQVAGYKLKLFAALVAGLALSFPAMATLYKWVDNNGTTHYGETIPPEYADKDHQVLNKEGRVIKSEEVMTPERRHAKEIEDAKNREEATAELEQARHDRTLINIYNSVDEIDLARSRNVQQINARIFAVNASVKAANDNLLSLQKEADNYTNANRKVPYSLRQDLQESKDRLTKLQQDATVPLAEKAALEERYNADKVRYIELTGKK